MGRGGQDPKRHARPILTSDCALSAPCVLEREVNPLWAREPLSRMGRTEGVGAVSRAGGLGDPNGLDGTGLTLAGLAGGTPLRDKGISDGFSLLSGEELIRLLGLTRLS